MKNETKSTEIQERVRKQRRLRNALLKSWRTDYVVKQLLAFSSGVKEQTLETQRALSRITSRCNPGTSDSL